MTADSAWADWPLDREIVLARVLDASPEAVFDAWTDPAQITAWFGPEGMVIETHAIDLTEGGVWRFDMVAADGTRYGNRMTFLILDRPHRIEVEHGADRDDDPGRFRMLVTFDAQSDGKTVLTLRQMHPSRAQRQATIGFGAVEYGVQTLDKLARHLAARAARAGA
ncbi:MULTISPECIES: SRPBCC family protein [unclassified Paracoccus (in: a-proteobacteria)]|uniref:SRPBCC family protein n=1 Tax=unclassified Paracoccus (in: a-proteobacteria) TaxID=2688777 RepID=UPI0012B29917|nr:MULTISPECIES: SRPBCC family protein [unclassified Paracoccus (in: a-proteobacteria)]UXU75027.1 SRPBCC family protein [Paracoccus sp. SMMA_5]UXU80930.1 SRPBCC family protein [Paracoccus sp. SMMA_5_TC]